VYSTNCGRADNITRMFWEGEKRRASRPTDKIHSPAVRMKLRGHYEKPSERRVREKAEAIRRARKLARKKLPCEGLLPMKPRVVPGAPGTGGPARTPRF
jgi:hypothetical protein